MPHCKIEYSANIEDKIETGALLERLHALIVDSGPFDLETIKSRMTAHDTYIVGDGKIDQAFVHLELAILSGRDEATRNQVSKALHAFLLEEFPETARTKTCSFTVEIREMDAECYTKFLTRP